MKLILKRIAKKAKYTIGHLYYLNDKNEEIYICDTIEDKDRGLTDSMSEEQIRKIKVKHQTAIPSGTYSVTTNVVSPKFNQKIYYHNYCKGKVPRLLHVKGFDGILIHRGTDQDSSSGCIIVGYNKTVGKVVNSQHAFEKLYNLIKKITQVTITIK